MVTFTGNGTLTLRNPELGNRRVINLRTLIKRSINGNMFGYVVKPPTITLHLEFRGLNRPQMLTVIAFLAANVGAALQYTDHRGVIWSGYILNSPFEETHTKHADNHFSLEFEGNHSFNYEDLTKYDYQGLSDSSYSSLES